MIGARLGLLHGVLIGCAGSLAFAFVVPVLDSAGVSVWAPVGLLAVAATVAVAVGVPDTKREASASSASASTFAPTPKLDAPLLGSVIESIGDGVLVADARGRVLLLNAKAREVLQLSATSGSDSDLDAVTTLGSDADGTGGELRAKFQKILERGETFSSEQPYGAPPRHYAMFLGPLRDRDNVITGVVAVLSDITERRATEQMKSDLVSMVTHEIRTPLSTVRGFAQILRRRGLSDEKSMEFLEIISRQSNRVVNLVNDFLDITRIETRRQHITKVPLELDEIVRNAVADLAPLAEEKNIDLRFEPPSSEIPPALGDRNLLEQVLINLLSNAIKYSPNGALAQIDIRRRQEYLAVSVRDTGLGVPRESLSRLFEKFYRVRCEDRKDVIGTGLGLALVKQIVEVHGGTIQVESEHGLGSTFTFTVPAVVPWPHQAEKEGSATVLTKREAVEPAVKGETEDQAPREAAVSA